MGRNFDFATPQSHVGFVRHDRGTLSRFLHPNLILFSPSSSPSPLLKQFQVDVFCLFFCYCHNHSQGSDREWKHMIKIMIMIVMVMMIIITMTLPTLSFMNHRAPFREGITLFASLCLLLSSSSSKLPCSS
jgi:hypothetical protein